VPSGLFSLLFILLRLINSRQ